MLAESGTMDGCSEPRLFSSCQCVCRGTPVSCLGSREARCSLTLHLLHMRLSSNSCRGVTAGLPRRRFGTRSFGTLCRLE